MNANANAQCRHPVTFALLIKTVEAPQHIDRSSYSPDRVIGMLYGRAKEGHDAISGELLDNPAVGFHRCDHFCKKGVEHIEKSLWRSAFAEAGEPSDVLEQNGHVSQFALKRDTVFENRLGDVVGDETAERVFDRLAFS